MLLHSKALRFPPLTVRFGECPIYQLKWTPVSHCCDKVVYQKPSETIRKHQKLSETRSTYTVLIGSVHYIASSEYKCLFLYLNILQIKEYVSRGQLTELQALRENWIYITSYTNTIRPALAATQHSKFGL